MTKNPSNTILLDDQDLQVLMSYATQVDTSSISAYTLLSQQSGGMPTQVLGSSMDYAESRLYQLGDDRKSINWRLSARSQETFVKTFHKESRPKVCIILDRRESLFFGTRCRLKLAQAIRLAVLIAMVAEQHQLKVDSLVFDEQLHWQYDLTQESFIAEVNQPVSHLHQPSSNIAIKEVLRAIQSLPQGSLVYLISDFIDIDSSDQAMLMQLDTSCYVQALHVIDQAELDLPLLGEWCLYDRQSQQAIMMNTSNKKEYQQFCQLAHDAMDEREQVITDLGIRYQRILTDVEEIASKIMMPLGFG
ncbi:MAG: DUF58 domain-containing protein [Thiotrichaceae bacterium]|nr:DUF58 domain-containing protein [Thiotrichaceae bacterium]